MVILSAGCKEKYDSPVISPQTGYLVVEGNINSGNGTTLIRLSRTTKLDNRNLITEPGALLKVEGDDNSSYNLTDNGSGLYSANLVLNPAVKYRLNITTSNGKKYLSDFTSVTNSPPIDSVSWKRENDGVQIYVNSHDPSNNTKYYQWDYSETWEFHSTYATSLKYKVTNLANGPSYEVVYRDSTNFKSDTTLYTCWQTEAASTINIGSTATLSSAVIYLPVVYVPPASQKLSYLYSIEVKQYGISKEGYEFLEKMKKNTETTGSLFDAQPSELSGNIHCVSDPNETVIGFVNVSLVQTKRIFISVNDVPGWNYSELCPSTKIANVSDSIREFGIGLLPTYIAEASPLGTIVSFYAAPPTCVDCTLRGTNIKPSFWP